MRMHHVCRRGLRNAHQDVSIRCGAYTTPIQYVQTWPDEPRWLVAQRQMELESELDLNDIRSNRKAYDSLLEDLMHTN